MKKDKINESLNVLNLGDYLKIEANGVSIIINGVENIESLTIKKENNGNSIILIESKH